MSLPIHFLSSKYYPFRIPNKRCAYIDLAIHVYVNNDSHSYSVKQMIDVSIVRKLDASVKYNKMEQPSFVQRLVILFWIGM